MEVEICDSCDRGFHLSCIPSKLVQQSITAICPECASVNDLGDRTVQLPDTQTQVIKKKRGRPRKIKLLLETPVPATEYEADGLPRTPNTVRSKTKERELKKPVKRVKKCPTSGCDGLGHTTGKFEMHHTVSGCPKYHNMTPQECKVQCTLQGRS